MANIISQIISNILIKRKIIDYSIILVEDKPNIENMSDKKLFIVGGKGYSKWAYMKCPCGCKEILTLSLMKKHNPSWTIKVDKLNRATLYPSIWKEDGCRSHFWIRKGKLIWAKSEY